MYFSSLEVELKWNSFWDVIDSLSNELTSGFREQRSEAYGVG